MTYAEVHSEVCEHRSLYLCCDCHLFKNSRNTREKKNTRSSSANYFSAQFKEPPVEFSAYCSYAKHVSSATTKEVMPRLNSHTQTNIPSSVNVCRSDMKRSPDSFITTSYDHAKKDTGSYQLQRYLNEPAGYQARLVNGVAPEHDGIDLLHLSRRNGAKRKETRRTAMRRKIKAIERKIG